MSIIGKQIAHYLIKEKLGEGGMGVVYKAEDTKLKRPVALKFLKPEALRNEKEKARFLREAQAAAALDHPNICTIYEINEFDGQTYIAMAYIEGQNLDEKIEQDPFKLEQTLDIAIQVAEGLKEAHEKGIIHRDIKSANIMVTPKGQVKIMDFGLAKLKGKTEKITKNGMTLGTLAYMSPEQARGKKVDHRTDIWSLGVVLYEMITGGLPFYGEYEAEVLYSILNDRPKTLKEHRPDIPKELEQIVVRALEKNREQRIQSANEVLSCLEKLRDEETVSGTRILDLKALFKSLKKPQITISTLTIIVLIIAAIFMLNRHRIKIQHARSLLPQIEKLAQAEKYFEAYDLAVQAEKYLKEDSTLLRLMPIISDTLAIITEPAAAHVFLKRFAPDEKGKFPDRAFIGLTPIFHLRIPRGDHKVYFEKEGYKPGECIASSRISRETSFLIGISKFRIEVKLLKAEKVPENMVFVPGGKYKLVGWGSPTTIEIMLDDYFIDKYEVRNEQFRSFIRAGGYSNRQYWKYPFMKDGERLSWEEAMKYFIDRTGLSGPRCWINQNFSEGKGNYPVTDITWYEAAAYAEFSGKSLPTIFQWEKAARGGIFTRLEGAVMPWGLVNPKESSIHRANFEGSETKRVDSYEFGISPYGCYNMAGNIKEWCINEMSGGYATTGGCWQDPIYTFSQYGLYPGIYTSNTLGFRCVCNFADTCGDQGAMKINMKLRTPTYSPVDKAAFKSYLSHYNYDKNPLNAQVVEVKETADWFREKVTFEGVNGDRIIAYLYLPRLVKKPYQCIISAPGGSVYYGTSIPVYTEWLFVPHIKSGRAVLAVVPKGAIERVPNYVIPRLNTVKYRDKIVLEAIEYSLGIDYLSTRDDIDMNKLAYIGVSGTARMGSIFAAVEDRYRSIIFIGGGISDYEMKKLPEVNPINFAPYIKSPKLLLNGKYDEVFSYETMALALFNLLSEPKKLVSFNSGHLPPLEERVPFINKWLDDTLGPVRYK